MTKYCPSCGEALVDDARFCKSCGKSLDSPGQNFSQTNNSQPYSVPVVEKSHTAAIVLGYVFAILIPIIGLIFAIYLLTRDDSPKAKQHGKYDLLVTILVWALSVILLLR